MSFMLEAKGLEKRFGAVVAASAINIGISAGERVSLTPQKTGIESKAAPPAATR